MRSYIEILKELQETVNSDRLPWEIEVKATDKIKELINLLWIFSD